MVDKNESGAVAHLTKYWAIYFCIAQLIVTFTFGYARIGNAEGKIAELQASQNVQDSIIDQQRTDAADIKARLASIDTSLLFIKSALNINK